MLRSKTLLLATCLTLACTANAMAQGGGGGGGGGGRGGRGGGPGGGRAMDAAMQAGGHQLNQANMTNAQMAQAMQNQNQNQNQSQQNMPTISQLATSLLSTYDTDSSGALDITELQAALTGLRGLMMSNNQPNGNAAAMNGAAMNGAAMNQPPRRR